MDNNKTKTNLPNGTQIKVNGSRTVYTLNNGSDRGANLVGPRGGQRTLVRNIHSNQLLMITMTGHRGRTELVESVEVVS